MTSRIITIAAIAAGLSIGCAIGGGSAGIALSFILRALR